MRFAGRSFFAAPVVQVEGTTYSLDAFERRFLFAGFDRSSRGPPPVELDPRVHFALVCAAAGCPPLSSMPYVAESLDVQLDRAVRNALASRAHIMWDAADPKLLASTIFHWYAADFGGAEGAFRFILRYANPALRAGLERYDVRRIDVYIPWDWSLNQTPGD